MPPPLRQSLKPVPKPRFCLQLHTRAKQMRSRNNCVLTIFQHLFDVILHACMYSFLSQKSTTQLCTYSTVPPNCYTKIDQESPTFLPKARSKHRQIRSTVVQYTALSSTTRMYKPPFHRVVMRPTPSVHVNNNYYIWLSGEPLRMLTPSSSYLREQRQKFAA